MTVQAPQRRVHKAKPRACFECMRVKDADEFDLGPSGYRRLMRCRECVARADEQREQARHARIAAQKSQTWSDQDGVWWRRCTQCRAEKPLETAFAFNRLTKSGNVVRLYECRKCASQRAMEAKKWRMRIDPATRKRATEAGARWRARNPNSVHRHWLAIKNDPARLERRRAAKRRQYARRALAEGRAVQVRVKNVPVVAESCSVLARPLAEACDAVIARWRVVGYEDPLWRLFSRSHDSRDSAQRALYAWRSGERERVEFDVADAVLTTAGLLWWDVWNEDTVRLWEYTFVRKRWSKARRRWERSGAWHAGADRGPDHKELEQVRRAFEGFPEELAA